MKKTRKTVSAIIICLYKKNKLLYLTVAIVTLLLMSFLTMNQEYTSCVVPIHRLQWWLSDINWDSKRVNYSGKNIRIAIIDSGVNIEHKDLKHCIEKEIRVSALDDYKADNTNHGTEIAGIIAAYPHSAKGVLGVAPGSKIISIDITDSIYGDINEINLIEGINIAIEEKVDIINISLGLSNSSMSLEKAINKALNSGIFVVAASGNTSRELYPAAYENVFSVDSYDKNNCIMYPKTQNNSILLPGKNIVTSSGSEYKGVDGTSYSCAIFTGILALILEKNPSTSYREILGIFSKKVNVNRILKGIQLL